MTDEAKRAWQKQVVRFRASGESVVAFAAREGIKPGRLYYWASKLKRAETSPATSPAPVRMMQLLRVPAGSSTALGVSIDVPDARARVVVEPGFDRGTLALVLETLGVRSAR